MASSKTLDRLFAENPHCHWCGRLTRRIAPVNGTMPEDGATIDHVYSRLDPRRQQVIEAGHENPTVLACSACNLRRSNEEVAALSPEERKARSQRPLKIARLTKEEFQKRFGKWRYDW